MKGHRERGRAVALVTADATLRRVAVGVLVVLFVAAGAMQAGSAVAHRTAIDLVQDRASAEAWRAGADITPRPSTCWLAMSTRMFEPSIRLTRILIHPR